MDKEKLKKANQIQSEISEIERSLKDLQNCDRCKGYGLEVRLQEKLSVPNYYFKIPKDSTDMILQMSKTLLENKLNRLKEEFDAL